MIASGLAAFFAATPAHAAPATGLAATSRTRIGPQWCDSHEVGDDARFEIDAKGAVHASRTVRVQVIGGALREIDMDGVPLSAKLDDSPAFVGEDGVSYPAHVSGIEARPAGVSTIRLSVLDPRGLRRGLYSLTITYAFDGVKEGLLTPGPAAWRFAWTTPPSRDGRDSVKVTAILPRGDSAPRDVPTAEAAALFRAVRHETNDEAELTRAHVTRGEAVTWTMLFDATAFDGVHRTRSTHRESMQSAGTTRGAGVALSAHGTSSDAFGAEAIETVDANARAVSPRDVLFALAIAAALATIAFAGRRVRAVLVILGTSVALSGALLGLLVHAAFAPLGFVLVSAAARFGAPDARVSRVRAGAWLLVALGAAVVLLEAAVWSKGIALVVTAALTSVVELVLAFAAWHRDPQRRLEALARALARQRGMRVVRESPTRVALLVPRLVASVRSLAVECVGTDLVLRVGLARGTAASRTTSTLEALGVARALAALGDRGSRRIEDGALVVSSALPRWLACRVMQVLFENLGERRNPRVQAGFPGKERRRLAPLAAPAT